jgi:hypothetical protein
MPGHECYHCKQWVEEGEAHDCWTTTEGALTGELSDDLKEAYERLRETAAEFGEQRIYASHHCIMFSRKSCYFFVRPKRDHLELCVFLGRTIKAPQVRRIDRSSKTKLVHFIRIQHRDEVEAPVTDWLLEAYRLPDLLAAQAAAGKGRQPGVKRAPVRKTSRPAGRTKRKAVRRAARSPAKARGRARAARPPRRSAKRGRG